MIILRPAALIPDLKQHDIGSGDLSYSFKPGRGLETLCYQLHLAVMTWLSLGIWFLWKTPVWDSNKVCLCRHSYMVQAKLGAQEVTFLHLHCTTNKQSATWNHKVCATHKMTCDHLSLDEILVFSQIWGPNWKSAYSIAWDKALTRPTWVHRLHVLIDAIEFIKALNFLAMVFVRLCRPIKVHTYRVGKI